MKVYGAAICIDCRNYKALQAQRGFDAEYVDILESTDHLKDFLQLRDHEAVFAPVRARGGIGIPLFVLDDGRMTLDMDEALAAIGQPPVKDEEIIEHREAVCDSCQ